MPASWVVDAHVTDDDVFVIRYDGAEHIEQHYLEAVPIAPGEPIELYYEGASSRKRDYVAGVQMFPVVSARLREVLDDAGVRGLEYHPAVLICADDGETDTGYHVLNILNQVAALDRDRARVEIFPGTEDIVARVHELAVREEALAGYDLVRLEEVRPIVLASDRLRATIEQSGVSGMTFIAVEDYGKR